MDGINPTDQFAGRVPQKGINGVPPEEASTYCRAARISWRALNSLIFTLIACDDTPIAAVRSVRKTFR